MNEETVQSLSKFVKEVFEDAYKNRIETESINIALSLFKRITSPVSVSDCNFYSNPQDIPKKAKSKKQ